MLIGKVEHLICETPALTATELAHLLTVERSNPSSRQSRPARAPGLV
jgi:hypothetical protein